MTTRRPAEQLASPAHPLIVSAGRAIPGAAELPPRVQGLVELVNEFVPGLHVDDLEDDADLFIESALRLEAVLAMVPHDQVWVRQFDGGTPRCVNAATSEVRPLSEFTHARSWGPLTSKDPHPQGVELVSRQGYARINAFREFAGRYVQIVSALEDPDTGINYDEMLRHVRRAATSSQEDAAAVKVIARDKAAPVSVIRQVSTLTDQQLIDAIRDGFGENEWLMYNLSVTPDAYLVQGYVNMVDEYRMFVVDGQVITGAACIEEHTPLNHLDQRKLEPGLDITFDPMLRLHRGSDDIRFAPRQVHSLVGFAQHVADEIQQEQPGLRSYVLDVAVDNLTGRPIVVELNDISNSGLYACDILALTSALHEHDAFPVIESWQTPAPLCAY